LGSCYEADDIEEWKCFEMDCGGHLVSLIPEAGIQLSNETIEHLSNFPHLRNFILSVEFENDDDVINFSLLSNMRNLSMSFERRFEDPELFQDLGLFSNLIVLDFFNDDDHGLIFFFNFYINFIYFRI